MDDKANLSIRKELIIDDFKGYAQKVMSDRDRINTLRQWEVTIIAAIIALVLGQNKLQNNLVPVLGVIVAFAILEILVRARMRLSTTVADDVWETVISREDEYILENYQLAWEVWAQVPLTKKMKFTFTSIGSPEFLMWNFVITIAMILIGYIR